MDTITVDATNQGTFCGSIASKYSYKPELRQRVDELYRAACNSNNRHFVLDGVILRAAQSTRAGAESYMQDGYVLVSVELPEITQEQIEQARALWNHFPFRKCFVALKAGEEMQIILKPTAHYAGKLARKGWTVRELRRV